MIYPLIQVKGGMDQIYEVPLVFFENISTATSCSDVLFPQWFRPVYRRCSGVKDHFEKLFKAFKRLSRAKQRVVIDTYRNSRNIKAICSNIGNLYPSLEKFDQSIRIPLAKLFEFLFNETLGTAIFKRQAKMHIDDHYAAFQQANNVHVCPFCGLETYTLPVFRRAEYDHFLPISTYPWLGVNLNNLVPMGDHCNGKKNACNILYSDRLATLRRAVWYPYEWINHSITLSCLEKPSLANMKGVWKTTFKAASANNQDKVKTWNDVFEIPLRFEAHISTYHKRFIEDFAHKNKLKGQKLTISQLISELIEYRNNRIGDIKLETMAKLKFVWADYHIKTKDSLQLAIFVNAIAYQRPRIKP